MLSILPLFLYGQRFVTIYGNINQSMNGAKIKMYVIYPFSSNLIVPKAIECVVTRGKFYFKMPASGIELYGFQTTTNGNFNNTSFQLSPKITTIEFKDIYLKDYIIKENNINIKYLKALSEIGTANNNTASVLSWVRKNIESPFCPQFLYSYNLTIPQDTLIKLFKLIPSANKKNSWGIDLSILIEKFFLGKMAPDFKQMDSNNISVSLSDFKGKYILLDFWASWCIPCRKENPVLKEAYKNYKKNGFEILGVSLDEARSDWIKAINDDNLEWTQISDLKGLNNDVSKLYNIHSIPTNYLIDPKGIVIAKNLRGNLLQEMLKKIFND